MSLFHRKPKAELTVLRPSTTSATVQLEMLADEVVKVAQQIQDTVQQLRNEGPDLPGRRFDDPRTPPKRANGGAT